MSQGGTVRTSYRAPFDYPRILGAYVAASAIPDAWMLIDSADCGTLRAEVIQDNHDWFANIIGPDGRYRIASTGMCPTTAILDRSELLGQQIGSLAARGGGALFIYPASVAAMVGVDYRAVLARFERGALKMPVMVVDPLDALGNWVDGYEQVLETLARDIELAPRAIEPGSVALIGNLFDRYEGDCTANVAELVRLLEGLGLSVVSVWLSGTSVAGLAEVARAETLLALPFAGRSAEILASRTGARVVRTGLPVGLSATWSWLRSVGEAVGRTSEARQLVEKEGLGVYRLLGKAVVQHILHREFFICAEATLGVALSGMIRELGGDVRVLALGGDSAGEVPPEAAHRILAAADLEELRSTLAGELPHCAQAPILLGNQRAIVASSSLKVLPVPFGFQAGGIHCLMPTPYLGVAGTVSLVERIANASALDQLRRA